jgi:fructose-specific phosphotransferase system IIC component
VRTAKRFLTYPLIGAGLLLTIVTVFAIFDSPVAHGMNNLANIWLQHRPDSGPTFWWREFPTVAQIAAFLGALIGFMMAVIDSPRS